MVGLIGLHRRGRSRDCGWWERGGGKRGIKFAGLFLCIRCRLLKTEIKLAVVVVVVDIWRCTVQMSLRSGFFAVHLSTSPSCQHFDVWLPNGKRLGVAVWLLCGCLASKVKPTTSLYVPACYALDCSVVVEAATKATDLPAFRMHDNAAVAKDYSRIGKVYDVELGLGVLA
jgi:hypothetical protein